MNSGGYVELLSSDFAAGWAELENGEAPLLLAMLGTRVIGAARAELKRPDLMQAAASSGLQARAFIIVYETPIPPQQASDVQIRRATAEQFLERTTRCRFDRRPKLQVLILGSPRSGTSELAHTLATHLALPWLGEGHAAHFFAQAAKNLAGDGGSGNEMVRFVAEQNVRGVVVAATKRAYFYLHSSASFLDKTPGVNMIRAAPFLIECFPDAKIIYLQRSGISNVMSRMAKFGGVFEEHCADWAEAWRAWRHIQPRLPRSLELRQEDMLNNPGGVACLVADYLGVPEQAPAFAQSLESGRLEQTGAGVQGATLAATGWSAERMAAFRRISGPAMDALGYKMSGEP